jgi:hypothetical protein
MRKVELSLLNSAHYNAALAVAASALDVKRLYEERAREDIRAMGLPVPRLQGERLLHYIERIAYAQGFDSEVGEYRGPRKSRRKKSEGRRRFSGRRR